MCGILGQFNLTNTIANEPFQKALASLNHRGPDACSQLRLKNGILGHTRLSIIGINSGKQPWKEGAINLVYNGELYNYLELKEELRSKGHQFSSDSDTEVVAKAILNWGDSAFERFNGMFALAYYDEKQNTITIARDKFGQKPLYFYFKNQELIFSSEISAIRVLAPSKYKLSTKNVIEYLRFEGFYGDQTPFDSITKLQPGEICRFDLQDFSTKGPQNFFQPKLLPKDYYSHDQFHNIVINSMERTLRSDVPLAFMLSGGLDSSLALAFAREVFPDKEFVAYHLENQEQSFNESEYAKIAAKQLETRLNLVQFSTKDLAEEAIKTLPLLDAPQADPGIIPKSFLSREIAKDYKVAISGDGADELFCGYLIFKAAKMAQYMKFCPNLLISSLKILFSKIPASHSYMSLDFIGNKFLKGFPSTTEKRSILWMEAIRREHIEAILDNDLIPSVCDPSLFEAFIAKELTNCRSTKDNEVESLQLKLLRSYLPDYVLTNSDRASMLHSLELRTPFLDNEIIDYALNMNPKFKVPGLQLKTELKKIGRKYFSKSFLNRKKMGFTSPLAIAVKTELRESIEECFSENAINKTGILNYDMVQNMWGRHLRGDENLYKEIWTLYTLQSWSLTNKLSIN
jgi:asparagine synthase (glutamine-hydrolysing)